MSNDILVQPNGNGANPPALDFTTCSKAAFDDRVRDLLLLREQHRVAHTLPANPFEQGDGWYDITPAMAKDGLLLSSGNREFSFAAMKAYAEDMASGDWVPTAQTIGFTNNELDDGHHRLGASYFGGFTFRSFVVVSTPDTPHRFAYIDQGKKRTIADALHIGGWNGTGKVMASAIQELAIRYFANALSVGKLPRFKKLNPRQALKFMETHPDFQDSSRYIIANHADALAVAQSKAAGIFFGHLVLTEYDKTVLADFFHPLGSGANLAEDSVILAVRNRLLLPELEGQVTPARGRLALLIKAFNMHLAGETMPRHRKSGNILPFDMPDPGKPFPRIKLINQ